MFALMWVLVLFCLSLGLIRPSGKPQAAAPVATGHGGPGRSQNMQYIPSSSTYYRPQQLASDLAVPQVPQVKFNLLVMSYDLCSK